MSANCQFPMPTHSGVTLAQWQKRLRPLHGLPPDTLGIHEIYRSIQGESSFAGLPCTFVRTTACHLRCTYCDTPHAFGKGEVLRGEQVLEAVRRLGVSLVEFTGGEPLLQPAVLPLMRQLCDEGFTVLLETSGSLSVAEVDGRVVKIVDLKTPSSGELQANCWANLQHLSRRDEIKLVIGNREDFEWAAATIAEHNLAQRCQLLMGVVYGQLEPAQLIEWILAAALPVRMQLQMHKYIWPADARGV